MNSTNTSLSFTSYELDGTYFRNDIAAIAAAKVLLHPELEKCCAARNWTLLAVEYQIETATIPAGDIHVLSTARAKRASSPVCEQFSSYGRYIRKHFPGSPFEGKHIANTWTREEMNCWSFFDKYQTADMVTTNDECFYGNLAGEISAYVAGSRPLRELLQLIQEKWRSAPDELAKNQAAEYFLCAEDLGLTKKITYHELLELLPDVFERAARLAELREQARAQGFRRQNGAQV